MYEDRTNWTYVGNGFYLVRTQAGFKQAAKHFYGRNEETNKALKEMKDYPTKYPSVCTFSMSYVGYTYISALCIPVNKLLDGIAAQENT